ncbi:MAG: hypothetical protein R2682_08105 [Pyrinomonadaceae bacterium]
MHFSAFAYVGESVEAQMYFENNFVQTAALLDELITGGVKHFMFSLDVRDIRRTARYRSMKSILRALPTRMAGQSFSSKECWPRMTRRMICGS